MAKVGKKVFVLLVTASFTAGARVPLEVLKDWIDESSRAVAPKKLAGAAGDAPRSSPTVIVSRACPHALLGACSPD